MKFIDTIIDLFLVGRTGCRDMRNTYLISWGQEISTIRCMWNTGDGSMDCQKNLPLKKTQTRNGACLNTTKNKEDDLVFLPFPCEIEC